MNLTADKYKKEIGNRGNTNLCEIKSYKVVDIIKENFSKHMSISMADAFTCIAVMY